MEPFAVKEYDGQLGFPGEGMERNPKGRYEAGTARVWNDVEKFVAELYPRAARRGLFNLASGLNRATKGSWIMTGSKMDSRE